ncbi:hypothetical protein QBC37DRAFT_193520 [Rhypophila decipiens]|uniref:FAD-dependent oxidoreductase-like enzyme n=1 Tax=Rhypophila decipiens TaxID=261697 RepID=A0AAN6Y4F8_9PEZI|nr:hypothetical protein QBC37DRAFT_193520 [Rhypophila decipiens]
MSVDTEQSAQVVNDMPDEDRLRLIDDPVTPLDDDELIPSSQQSMPSTQGANSRAASPLINDGLAGPAIIPSSLTPPPSSQLPTTAAAGAVNPLAPSYVVPQRSGIFSPPATTLNGVKRETSDAAKFTVPTARQVDEASIEELRTMLKGCMAEHAKLKMEAAHHKLQYNLLSLQADEDSKRAAVEHEMTRREVEALRAAEHSRQARRDLSAASESMQTKYLQLKVFYEQALEENEVLAKKFKAARKVIQQKEDEVMQLKEDQEMLLNRIRENREHFHHLCSPGGLFHGVMSPAKTQLTASTPQQHRATPRQTPKSAAVHREPRDNRNGHNFDVLLQALSSQENNSAGNSAPSTPITGLRPAPRAQSKHARNAQSMSSLPSTPVGRTRLDHGGLLPSVNLVPQTEPPHIRSRFVPETPPPAARSRERRTSRESTISAEDNAELARQALQVASFASRGSQHSRSGSRRMSQSLGGGGGGEEEPVYESQASQAASEMLRRDPRESFEVAGSGNNSRDVTPAVAPAADKSTKLQAKLFGGLNKSGVSTSEKRKFSGGNSGAPSAAGEARGAISPTKKLRLAGGLRDPGQVGLGIQYSQ